MVTHNIILGENIDFFVKDQVRNGSFKTENEVVIAALNLLKKEFESLQKLNQLLLDGEESGYGLTFDIDAFKREMKKKYIKNEV